MTKDKGHGVRYVALLVSYFVLEPLSASRLLPRRIERWHTQLAFRLDTWGHA